MASDLKIVGIYMEKTQKLPDYKPACIGSKTKAMRALNAKGSYGCFRDLCEEHRKRR